MALSPALGNKEQCEDLLGSLLFLSYSPGNGHGATVGKAKVILHRIRFCQLPHKRHRESCETEVSPEEAWGRAFQPTNLQRWGRGPEPLGLESLFPVPQPDS